MFTKEIELQKKDGRFLALIDALPASPKAILTTGSRVESSYDGLHWEEVLVSEHQFSAIEEGNGTIVAVGFNAQVASSTI